MSAWRSCLLVTIVLVVGLSAAAPAQDSAPTEKDLRARVEATEGKERGAAAAALGTLLEGESRWSESASAWRQARRLRGDLADLEGEARVLLAFAQDVFAQGEQGAPLLAAFEDAKLALRRARDGGSKSVEVSLGLAQCAEVDRDPHTQIAELRAAVERFPADPRPRHALATALAGNGNPKEALPIVASFSDEHPDDVEFALVLASVAKAAGDTDRQSAAASRAVRAAPNDRRAWDALWNVFAAKQRWGELADAAAAIAIAHPESAYAAHYAGVACGYARRLDEALVHLEKAWTLEPRNHGARTEAARLLRDEKNDRPGAIRLYMQVLDADPANRSAQAGLSFLAVRLSNEGDPAASVPLFRRIAQVLPGNSGAQSDLALALRWSGKYDESEKAYLAAIAADPLNAQALNDYGLMLIVAGRIEDARAAFMRGHAVDPKHNDCIENYAFLAQASGDRPAALEWFRKAHRAALERGDDGGHHRITVDGERFPPPPLR